jgi:hypothetical protein
VETLKDLFGKASSAKNGRGKITTVYLFTPDLTSVQDS